MIHVVSIVAWSEPSNHRCSLDRSGSFWYSSRTMLKMRLQRIGRKNDASFRVVVTDSRNAAKRGKNVELLGSYNPRTDTFQVDAEKAK